MAVVMVSWVKGEVEDAQQEFIEAIEEIEEITNGHQTQYNR